MSKSLEKFNNSIKDAENLLIFLTTIQKRKMQKSLNELAL